MLAQGIDSAVKPTPIEIARFRLDALLGEFTDPNPGQAKGGHACGIGFPLGFGPMFGVIADAEGAY